MLSKLKEIQVLTDKSELFSELQSASQAKDDLEIPPWNLTKPASKALEQQRQVLEKLNAEQKSPALALITKYEKNVSNDRAEIDVDKAAPDWNACSTVFSGNKLDKQDSKGTVASNPAGRTILLKKPSPGKSPAKSRKEDVKDKVSAPVLVPAVKYFFESAAGGSTAECDNSVENDANSRSTSVNSRTSSPDRDALKLCITNSAKMNNDNETLESRKRPSTEHREKSSLKKPRMDDDIAAGKATRRMSVTFSPDIEVKTITPPASAGEYSETDTSDSQRKESASQKKVERKNFHKERKQEEMHKKRKKSSRRKDEDDSTSENTKASEDSTENVANFTAQDSTAGDPPDLVQENSVQQLDDKQICEQPTKAHHKKHRHHHHHAKVASINSFEKGDLHSTKKLVISLLQPFYKKLLTKDQFKDAAKTVNEQLHQETNVTVDNLKQVAERLVDEYLEDVSPDPSFPGPDLPSD